MLPCRRFADVLADACARLGADVGRYSFIAVDFHHILLAGLPAHSLALRPAHSRGHLYVTSYTEGFSHFVTSMTAPVASGWSDLAGWGSHPLESAALSRRTRIADIAGSGGRRRLRAGSALTSVGSGTTGGHARAVIRSKAQNGLPPLASRCALPLVIEALSYRGTSHARGTKSVPYAAMRS